MKALFIVVVFLVSCSSSVQLPTQTEKVGFVRAPVPINQVRICWPWRGGIICEELSMFPGTKAFMIRGAEK